MNLYAFRHMVLSHACIPFHHLGILQNYHKNYKKSNPPRDEVLRGGLLILLLPVSPKKRFFISAVASSAPEIAPATVVVKTRRRIAFWLWQKNFHAQIYPA